MAFRSRSRYRVRTMPMIVVVVGSLTWGCAALSGADQPVSAPQSPSFVTTASAPAATCRPTVDYDAMQRQLQREFNGGHRDLDLVRSVLVSVEGQTTMTYFHKRKLTEHAHVWSVTKSVISILVGIAVDEGRLRVDQTLQELLPQQASAMTPQQASITLRQLLTMTSGISGHDGGLNLSADDTVSQILAYGMGNDPGVAFEYSNSSAHLVAAVLHNAVDQPVLDYARAKLFDPLSIDTRPAWHGLDTGSPTSGVQQARLCLGNRSCGHQCRRVRPQVDSCGHDQGRRTLRQ
jgi:CubicO group peptidase (beta-lactamase class C family)